MAHNNYKLNYRLNYRLNVSIARTAKRLKQLCALPDRTSEIQYKIDVTKIEHKTLSKLLQEAGTPIDIKLDAEGKVVPNE